MPCRLGSPLQLLGLQLVLAAAAEGGVDEQAGEAKGTQVAGTAL